MPENRMVLEASADEVLSYWGNGYLSKIGGKVEWHDLNPFDSTYSVNPGLTLTSWDVPIAVDPLAKTVYAFGNAVKPSLRIELHILGETEPSLGNELVADTYELLTPLPSNGWPVFYVDRPSQAGTAIASEDASTKKLRVYGGTTVGGEISNVKGVFILDYAVAVENDTGWLLYQRMGPYDVPSRTMSLGQIPGNPRPLALLGDTLLVASDTFSEDGKTQTGCALYTYGIYTRLVQQIWDASSTGAVSKILTLTPVEPDDFLVVLGSLPDLKILTLGNLENNTWNSQSTATLSNPLTSTQVFLLPVETELTYPESTVTQESTLTQESIISPEHPI
jgi:hypothetical protein